LETEAKLLFPLNFMSSYCELKGNYSFTKAENTTKQGATAGAQLPRQPYEKANLSGTLTHYDGHSFRVEGRFVGFRFTTAQNTKYLPAYFVLDAAVNLKIGERYQLTVSGRNLLNSEYVDIREFPVPGRELAVGLEVSF